MSAVSARRSIVLNMAFNRTLLPLSGTFTETVAFSASLLLLALMMAVYAVAPTVSILWLPVVIAATVLLSVGVAYPAALLGVWMPEIGNFVLSFVRVLFFIAPGLVPLSQISGTAHDLLLINPMTGLFESYRDALLYGNAPGAFELLYPAALGVALLPCSCRCSAPNSGSSQRSWSSDRQPRPSRPTGLACGFSSTATSAP